MKAIYRNANKSERHRFELKSLQSVVLFLEESPFSQETKMLNESLLVFDVI
jgi:hypothetical protein